MASPNKPRRGASAPRIVFLFPGTGNQHRGMGRNLNARFPAARAFLDDLAATLGYDLRRTMFRGSREELFPPADSPNFSLFLEVIAALSLAVFRALEREGIHPDAVAGRSMGELPALMAAGAIAAGDGFRLLRAMSAGQVDCLRRPGEMMTVYGLEERQARSLCRTISRDVGCCELIAHFPVRQISVIGGLVEATQSFRTRSAPMGASRFHPSQEIGPFHTSLMRSLSSRMRAELAGTPFRPPDVPVWTNVSARPVASPAVLRRHLAAQMDGPVLWPQTIEGLLDAGARVFVELAPGRMLTDFMFRLPADARVLPTDTPEHLREAIAFLKAVD